MARANRSALLVAPTGAGKTLAGFLPSLVELSERRAPTPAGTPVGRAPPPRSRGLHTLYISPLKALAVEELEKEINAKANNGPLKKLFDTFNTALATLTVEKFADAYAQTITYGMLAARWISSDDENKPLFTRKNLKDLLPETSAFLKDLFDKLVNNSNFDKNLTWLLDDITSLLARTSVKEVFQDEKRDPSIHFYEDFLDAYDPQVRKDQGVYYTPDEVVSYIVRTAHASLQNDFGLPLGLGVHASNLRDDAEKLGPGHTKYSDALRRFDDAREAYRTAYLLPAALGAATLTVAAVFLVRVRTYRPASDKPRAALSLTLGGAWLDGSF